MLSCSKCCALTDTEGSTRIKPRRVISSYIQNLLHQLTPPTFQLFLISNDQFLGQKASSMSHFDQ